VLVGELDRLLPPSSRPATVRNNVATVSAFAERRFGSGTLAQQLNALQEYQIEEKAATARPFFSFDLTSGRVLRTARRLSTRPGLGLEAQLAEAHRGTAARKLDAGLDQLADLAPDTALCLNELISEVILAKVDHFGGGSVSDVIGVIWISPKPEWDATKYAEVILHEYVHHTLFLDDMINKLFAWTVEDMATDAGLVQSAVLKIKRGYDKSFHSAFVADALRSYYSCLEIPNRSGADDLNLALTMDGLRARDHCLTDHGRGRLRELESQQPDAVELIREHA